MKIIAFKRAGKIRSLHPLFITEYVESCHLPSTEGYETAPEHLFLKELALNHERHEEHLKRLAEEQKILIDTVLQRGSKASKEEKELEREYKKFRAFMRHSGRENA